MTTRNTLPMLLSLAALAAAGCASKPAASARPAAGPTAAPSDEYPMIVRLEGRHYSVTASSGPHGVVYTAHGRDGDLVVANATLDELRQRHPEIYQQIVPGIAEKGESAGPDRRTATDADASTNGPAPRRGEHLLMSADR